MTKAINTADQEIKERLSMTKVIENEECSTFFLFAFGRWFELPVLTNKLFIDVLIFLFYAWSFALQCYMIEEQIAFEKWWDGKPFKRCVKSLCNDSVDINDIEMDDVPKNDPGAVDVNVADPKSPKSSHDEVKNEQP